MGWPLGANAGGGVVHLPPRGQPGLRRLRRPPELRATRYLYPYMEFQRFKHHPLIAELLEGRQARRLRRARHHRGRLAVAAEARLPGRRAAGLRGGHGQRPAHQGQPQRHAVGHRRGRGRPGRHRRRARGRRAGGLRHARCAPAPIGRDLQAGAATSSRSGRATASWPRWCCGGLDMWTQHAARTARSSARMSPRQDRRRGHRAAPSTRADRLPQARRRAVSFDRLTNVAFSRHQPRRGPARAPEAEGPRHPDRRSTCRSTPSPRSATARPASTRWCATPTAEPALPDQLPELRPLQDLRHQGPVPEHRLDDAAGRRRAELPEHVRPRGGPAGRGAIATRRPAA